MQVNLNFSKNNINIIKITIYNFQEKNEIFIIFSENETNGKIQFIRKLGQTRTLVKFFTESGSKRSLKKL